MNINHRLSHRPLESGAPPRHRHRLIFVLRLFSDASVWIDFKRHRVMCVGSIWVCRWGWGDRRGTWPRSWLDVPPCMSGADPGGVRRCLSRCGPAEHPAPVRPAMQGCVGPARRHFFPNQERPRHRLIDHFYGFRSMAGWKAKWNWSLSLMVGTHTIPYHTMK